MIIEIHAAEGGEDSKSLVHEQFAIYAKRAAKYGLTIEILDQRPGLTVFSVNDNKIFSNESGGHRWQRVPPNEKRGRVHTSTITIAVLPEPTAVELKIDPRDLEYTTTRGSGPGGQNRNKRETCVILTHRPTRTVVRCENERSQEQNKQMALALLRAKLWEAEQSRLAGQRVAERKAQVGTGMRGDKRRTIACQRGTVVDHLLGKRWELSRYLRGDWD